ncbi:MAG TPA: nitronate monooxygenase [Gemmatimonadaceae bacterium]
MRDRLGVALPIIQAPMAGSQGSGLAIAVCEAGGLGSLPMAMLSSDAMRAEIGAVRAATSRPFNVNFFCHTEPAPDAAREAAWRATLAPYYRELGLDVDAIPAGPARRPFDADAAELLLELAPPVVSFHFGLPAGSLLDVVRRTGATILSSATTVDEARWLEERGVHAIIAQGLEAGGHRGHFLSDDLTLQSGTIALVPQIARAVRVPVIAAGGIADAQGVAAALALGASAVQVGTSYLLCPEATTRAVHRTALASDDARHTALTNLFSGRPARGIVNRVMRELGAMSNVAPPFPLASATIAPLRAAAEGEGHSDFSPLWAGQNASGCRAAPAAEITRALAARL